MTAAVRLAGLAERVRGHVPPDRLPALDDAIARALAGRVRVLVLGEAKRGKSTLVNALFARELLPTGALPVTSVATSVTVESTVDAEVRYRDGRRHPLRLGDVAELVSERGNPGNVRNVDTVRITAPSPYLPAGTEVVDSPGTGSVHQANTDEAARARDSVDLAVLVVSADPPVSQAELALAAEVTATAAALAVVVNKIDLVQAGDVAEIVAFTRQAVAGPLGSEVPVLPMSLRTSGPDDLVAWLTERIARSGETDVVASTARAWRRESAAVLDGLRIEREILGRTAEDSTRAVKELRAIIDRARSAETAAIDHVRGEARRSRARLDASHERAVAAATTAARQQLGAELPAEPARPEAAAGVVRGQLSERVVEAGAGWFRQTGEELEAAARDAAQQATAGLTAELVRARHAVAGVLDLRLADAPVPDPPAPPRLPELELGPEVVWRELVTTALAHRLPASVRRKRLHRHLSAWAENAVPRPFGRARSTLQHWLRDVVRGDERALAEIWRTQLAALEAGLGAADRSRGSAPDAKLAELDGRIASVRQVVRELELVSSGSPAEAR
ncbi:dynamin family protein [Amycolatopsis silviterrae]|uniref:Dynamin family protein n=1 Tax=Amycolatopsis silviterrae TaxID=1656914 RepID=A0ABW5HNR7_9PSEU